MEKLITFLEYTFDSESLKKSVFSRKKGFKYEQFLKNVEGNYIYEHFNTYKNF